MQVRDIYLHGSLGKKFGRHYRFAVDTPAEAIRALISQVRGFRKAIEVGAWRLTRGPNKTENAMSVVELDLRFGNVCEMHILPAAKGRKSGGTGKIILGVVLLVVAIVLAVFVGPAPLIAWGDLVLMTGTSLAISAALQGASLIFMGISMLMAPQPRPRDNLTTAKNESFVFSGPVNQHGQGHILPLIYGQVRVGSFIASASIKAEEFVDTTAQNPQTVFGRAYNIITGVTLS